MHIISLIAVVIHFEYYVILQYRMFVMSKRKLHKEQKVTSWPSLVSGHISKFLQITRKEEDDHDDDKMAAAIKGLDLSHLHSM